MEKEIMTVREWVTAFQNGEFDAGDFNTQVKAGWYDWFCDDKRLSGKTKKIGKLLSRITNSFILDNFRVWFKNNCPCVGPLYDDFRFEPIDESKRDQFYFGVACEDRRNGSKYGVFEAQLGYKMRFYTNSVASLISYIDWLGAGFQSIVEGTVNAEI